MKQKIYLVDVSSMFFRAFFAVRPLTSPSGLPTNAIFGFLSMIMKLLKSDRPTHLVFCYDRPEPSFRKEIYSDYKANRSEMPEDLSPQIPYIKKLAELLGIPSIEIAGFEADDLIGTLAENAHAAGWDVHIVSGDKDFCQLIRDGVYMDDTMKGVRLNESGVIEKYGIRPNQFIDYLALVGDSSDHVPGVAGIGPKTATQLLQQLESLDGIYQNLDKISSKSVREKLEKDREKAHLSKQLVTIRTDVELKFGLDDCRLREVNRDQFHSLLKELDFKALKYSDADFYWSAKTPNTAAPSDTTPAETQVPAASALKTGSVAELEKTVERGGSIWLLNGPSGSWLVRAGSEDMILQGENAKLVDWLERQEIRLLGYDLKKLAHDLGLSTLRVAWDGLLAAYLLGPGKSLEEQRVLQTYLGETVGDPNQLLGAHLQLKKILESRIVEMHGTQLLQDLDQPVCEVLYQMEKLGVGLNVEFLKEFSKELSESLSKVEEQIFQISKMPFNVASPKQLSQVLFERLALPPGKKTKTGYSTDSDVLEKLKGQNPIIEMILEHREVAKLKSTYVDAFPSMLGKDGRLHTTFFQALTTTGRLSSSDPNLQNIPIRTTRGARVREAFVAAPGKVFLSADYSQIELRVLAHICEDANMIQAFENDLDIHAATASEVFGVKLDEVTSAQRRVAKAVNFGIAYGQGAFGLAETLGISRTESQGIIQRYFTRFAGVKNYIEDTVKSATAKGYVETLAGRRRYLDELNSQNPAIRKFGERAAINAPIQGTAADIVKKAMVDVAKQVPVPLILQVHDELIFEGSAADFETHGKKIVHLMESAFPLKVPLRVQIGQGPTWAAASH